MGSSLLQEEWSTQSWPMLDTPTWMGTHTLLLMATHTEDSLLTPTVRLSLWTSPLLLLPRLSSLLLVESSLHLELWPMLDSPMLLDSPTPDSSLTPTVPSSLLSLPMLLPPEPSTSPPTPAPKNQIVC